MAGKKGQKKRVWSDDEKLSICAQARVPGVPVARRYAMNTNLIHKWLVALDALVRGALSDPSTTGDRQRVPSHFSVVHLGAF